MINQIFCSIHQAGPYNNESIQKVKHEHEFNNCSWESYDPQKHIANYNESQITSTKELKENISRDIYEFAKSKIKKLVVTNNDSDQVYALIENNDHIETWNLGSSKTKDWLRFRYYKETGENYSDDAYKNAIALLKAEAVNDGAPRVFIYNRVAMIEKTVYYDLVSLDFKAVKITENSVEIINLDENTPIFVRSQHQQQQVMPKFGRKGAMADLSQLYRISRKDRLLFEIHQVAMFLEKCPIPIMNILGEQGSNKTTLAKSVKQLVDPSGNNISSLPRKNEELYLHFYNRYLASFDNVSWFSQTVSDILCRAITGEGQSKRQLYTDSNEVIYNYQRKIIVNGIAPSLEFPDYRERSIFYETLPLKEHERLTEEEYQKRFKELLPYVLGEIFVALQNALQMYDSVKSELKDLPRMADFTIYGECISRALGYEPFSFVEQYKERMSVNALDIVESYPIIQIIEKLMEGKSRYEDTVSRFHKDVMIISGEEGIEVHSKSVQFPASPNKVRQHIQKLKANLRVMGFEIDIYQYTKRDGKHPKNRHVICIDRIGIQGTLLQDGCELPLPSLPSLPAQNHEQNNIISGRDRSLDSQILQVPLPKSASIANKNESGKHGTDGSDVLDTSGGQHP